MPLHRLSTKKQCSCMKRNTITPLGNLRTGDRFYFQGDKKKTVYQTTGAKLKKPYVAYTEFPNATHPERWQKSARAYLFVCFLRHAVPAPGDECRLSELKTGDVFCFSNRIVDEYQVLKPGNDSYLAIIQEVNSSSHAVVESTDMQVIFIRKAEEVVV